MGVSRSVVRLPREGSYVDARIRCQEGPLVISVDTCSRHLLHDFGKEVAIGYLKSCGMRVLERQWSCAQGRAGIVARDDGCAVLVDLRVTGPDDKGRPRHNVKVPIELRGAYRRIAMMYLAKHCAVSECRFDVISICFMNDRDACLRHVLGAFSMETNE